MAKRETNRGFSLSQASTVTLTNSTAETTLFSAVIPAGSMGTSKKLVLNLLSTLTTPLLSIPAITIKLKLGGSTLTLVSNVGLAASQTNAPVIIIATIRNKDASNVQIVYAQVSQASSTLPMLIDSSKASFATWSVDTTINQTLAVTAQFGGLSAGTILVSQDADIDLT